MGYKLGKKSMGQLVGLYPDLSFAVTEAIKITAQDFMAFDGVRSTAQQRKLVAKGASKTMDSYHLYGLAVDLVPYINGQPRWEEKPCKVINKAMNSVIKAHGLAIDWGYGMWGWDMPHYQLTGMKKVYDVRNLKHDIGR